MGTTTGPELCVCIYSSQVSPNGKLVQVEEDFKCGYVEDDRLYMCQKHYREAVDALRAFYKNKWYENLPFLNKKAR